MTADVAAGWSSKMEVWKDLEGYEGYYKVSTEGRVSGWKGNILKPQPRRHGYLAVWLYKDGGKKQVSVHRLVAMTFIPNPDGLPEVNHLDEDKTNNKASNLAWCDHRFNTNYGTAQQRRSAKIRNNSHSRPVAMYTKDGELVRVFPSIAEATRNGYASGNVYKCMKGKYSHAYGYIWKYARNEV